MENAYDRPANVSFMKDEPLNSIVVDSSNGQPLYDVCTPWKLTGRVTTIRRLGPGVTSGLEPTIAEIHWHSLTSTKVTFYGTTTVKVKDWLKSKGKFSSSRILTTPDGRSYTWSGSTGHFTLTNNSTNTQVAKSHGSKKGWFWGTPRKMNIDIWPEGMHFIETLIVSFVIMEKLARESDEAAAAAAGAAGGA